MPTTATLAVRVFAAVAAVSTTWVLTTAVISIGEPDLQSVLAKHQTTETQPAMAAAAAPIALVADAVTDAQRDAGR